MRSPSFSFLLAILLITSGSSALAQGVVSYQADWYEVWSAGYPVRHYGQPVAFTPDCPQFSQCRQFSGYGMGMFRSSERLYHLFQGNDKSQIEKSATWIGDHVDALVRRDWDGAYEKVPGFFSLPPFSSLATQWDTSVWPTLPSSAGGIAWQIGSGFVPIPGPRLDSDSPGASRIYYFFAPESEFNGGLGGHLIGFASRLAPTSLSAPVPWTSVWKDAASRNDGTYRLLNGYPLRTLHPGNFTPLLKFRGDAAISGGLQGGARVFGGLTGWYDSGWFYLLTSTVSSRQSCVT